MKRNPEANWYAWQPLQALRSSGRAWMPAPLSPWTARRRIRFATRGRLKAERVPRYAATLLFAGALKQTVDAIRLRRRLRRGMDAELWATEGTKADSIHAMPRRAGLDRRKTWNGGLPYIRANHEEEEEKREHPPMDLDEHPRKNPENWARKDEHDDETTEPETPTLCPAAFREARLPRRDLLPAGMDAGR